MLVFTIFKCNRETDLKNDQTRKPHTLTEPIVRAPHETLPPRDTVVWRGETFRLFTVQSLCGCVYEYICDWGHLLYPQVISTVQTY